MHRRSAMSPFRAGWLIRRAAFLGLLALTAFVLAVPLGALTVASASSRLAEETSEETREQSELARVGPTAAPSVGVKRRHRLLPRRLLLLARPWPHGRSQLEAPARHDAYKRPLRC